MTGYRGPRNAPDAARGKYWSSGSLDELMPAQQSPGALCIPHWTPIATMIRRSAKRAAPWVPIEGAPISEPEARSLRDQGLLLMANRREGAVTVLGDTSCQQCVRNLTYQEKGLTNQCVTRTQR